jgi:arylsulfatase A-like enzyme
MKNYLLTYILSLCIIFLLGCNQKEKKTEDALKNPNIVFILADDLGYGDISINGQSKFFTPHIDKLAEDGMLFTQHYAGSTVCAPSRSSLLTGLHTGHTYIRGNKEFKEEGQFPLKDSEITIAEILKTKGYVTGAFGKWGLGFPSSEGDPNNQGFDEFYGYNCQRLAHNYFPYHLWENQNKIILEENSDTKIGIYAPNLIHKKALQFIEKHKDSTFFMLYPSVLPHAELAAPAEFMDLYSNQFSPETPYNGIDDGKRYKNGGYSSQLKPRAAFAAMVNLLDHQVGEILQKLEELGIADNTIIIFTSDNGPHQEGGADPDFFDSNGKLRGYKRDLYEGGIRVPLIVSWPSKIKSNSVSNHVSAFWDVLPTICEITNQSIPVTDGISFLPTLLGNDQQKHKYLYWEFLEKGGKQAVRLGDWKGVRLNMSNNQNAPIELYNLKTDIEEKQNLAKKYPSIVDTISAIMNKEHRFSKNYSFKYEGME